MPIGFLVLVDLRALRSLHCPPLVGCAPDYWIMGGWFWLWVLIAILGWHDFGAPWAALVH
jgi:hypothetical protein